MEPYTVKTEYKVHANYVYNFALKEGHTARLEDETSVLVIPRGARDDFTARLPFPFQKVDACPLKPYKKKTSALIEPHTQLMPATSRSWFYATELASIYKFPAPNPATEYVIGVVSFGGGLYGTVNADGVLTNGDCQAYWTLCGIPAESHPKVIVKTLYGATNNPADSSTDENTLDIQTIGACCPTAATTIILYIAPNNLNNFPILLNTMINVPVVAGGKSYRPQCINVSWGAPEIYYSSSLLTFTNNVLANAVSLGINVTVASGDNGSNDGVGGSGQYTDFPSSSPNVIACGGTNLSCPNLTYDQYTVETAWSSGGGGVSGFFSRPAYQTVSGNKRKTPDVATVADPSTGVLFIVNSQRVVYGGTSVAAPTVAGFFAAANCRVWMNPYFYRAPSSNFHDIVSGSNGAYRASIGYDNCTGLGSLKGDLLKNIFLVGVSSLSFGASAVSLGIGRTYQAQVSMNPANASVKDVTWSSSNTGIATVNSSGLVTGVASGTAQITATSVDGGKTASFNVNVFIPVTGVTVSPSTLTLRRNATARLTATVAPSNAANINVSWRSTATAIATVSSTGLVTAKNRGTAIIRVTTADGGFTADCRVTVN